jgi:hypothetical protein
MHLLSTMSGKDPQRAIFWDVVAEPKATKTNNSSTSLLLWQCKFGCLYCFNSLNQHPKLMWLLYVLPRLKFKNTTFCPQNVFKYFTWISEQIGIISLCITDWSLIAFKNCEKLLSASSCMSVYPHGTTRLPPEGFSWNLIFGTSIVYYYYYYYYYYLLQLSCHSVAVVLTLVTNKNKYT